LGNYKGAQIYYEAWSEHKLMLILTKKKGGNMRHSKISQSHHWVVFFLVFMITGAFSSNWPSDEAINTWVTKALLDDPRIFSEQIMVNTQDGIVRLNGLVSNLAEKKFADMEAKKN
jgi:hypothetical protein